jgi:hypothetical protein
MSTEFCCEDAELAEGEEVGARVVDDEGALARAPNHLEDLRLGRKQVDVVEQTLKERKTKKYYFKTLSMGAYTLGNKGSGRMLKILKIIMHLNTKIKDPS